MLKTTENSMIENTEAELTKSTRVLTQLRMHDPYNLVKL